MSDGDDEKQIIENISSTESFGDKSHDNNHISSHNCRETILDKFETLANQLAAGWKYHVSHTHAIRNAWSSFEDFYTNICSFASITLTNNSSASSDYSSLLSLPSNRLISVDSDQQSELNALVNSNNGRISPYLCQKKLIEKVGAFVSQLSPNWSYHIANTEGIVEAWQDFEHYFLHMCTVDHGK
ncbi:unnamed protein product [Anisakis simplex]|uniref:Uncharacterized protein n=1 Tax=Anisakis simplex TaxID=6269 RepID=A0A0M3JST5_ANISI|nr:unnamed protein product [Anisakis simplex]